ncbi:BnaC05g32610D [Brassica napus]|uniref:BnaC05g32610D protein n=1 Tax=Brassica napus TaxID=3708 RepID=A0A078GHE4_BRANA|nr:BnaC05g32610D [Brassica napus]
MPHRIKISTNRKKPSVPSPKVSLSSAFVAVRLRILAFSTSSFIFIAFPLPFQL